MRITTRVVILAALSCHGLLSATIDVYLAAPGVQTSPIAGSATETFDGLATGNRTTTYASSIGDYVLSTTAPFNIQNANQYGGAGGSRYVALGAQSGTSAPFTLNLPSPQEYFGFWWSAGDSNNGVTFYKNGVELVRFSSADLIAFLSPSGGTIQAADGRFYEIDDYFGNPNLPGQNGGEPYAYVMFFGNGVAFDQIVFDNNGLTGSGFESDNHSVYAGPATPPETSVYVKEVTSPALAAVPEPNTLALSGFGLALLALSRIRRRTAIRG